MRTVWYQLVCNCILFEWSRVLKNSLNIAWMNSINYLHSEIHYDCWWDLELDLDCIILKYYL